MNDRPKPKKITIAAILAALAAVFTVAADFVQQLNGGHERSE
jgi:hypothetical protein